MGFTVYDVLPNPSDPIAIYGDDLAPGWGNWSWDNAVDLASTSIAPIEGVQSIEVAYRAPWAGLYLHHGGLDIKGKTDLVFSINGGAAGGQGLQVIALDGTGSISGLVPLGNYLPTVQAGTWNSVSIPLADLSVLDTVVTGFIIQGTTGVTEKTFYVDDVKIQ